MHHDDMTEFKRLRRLINGLKRPQIARLILAYRPSSRPNRTLSLTDLRDSLAMIAYHDVATKNKILELSQKGK